MRVCQDQRVTGVMRALRAAVDLQGWGTKVIRETQGLLDCLVWLGFQGKATKEKRGIKGLLDPLVLGDLLDWV